MFSMSHNTVLTKDNIDSILESFANHYISQDNVLPINIYIVGGSAIVMRFDYRQSTIDIDALYEKNYQVDLAIKETALEKNVPSDWLNSDFVNTPSYSPNISKASYLYKTINDKVNIYCLKPEYLIAMKIKSSRPTGGDLEDVLKMIYELRYKKQDISYGKIIDAYLFLYKDFSNTYQYFLDKTKEAFETSMEEIEVILGKIRY